MSDINPGAKEPKRKLTIYIINGLLVGCTLCAIVWGISTYFGLDHELYTNDAQVEEYINPVNIRIPGYIKEVRFQEHQRVKKGDTLVIVDDREYRIGLEQAEAAYLSTLAARHVAASTVSTVHSSLSVSDANIKASESRLWNARKNFHRYENLLKEGAATQQQFDQVSAEYNALTAQTNALKRQRNTNQFSINETFKRLAVNDAEVKRAHAAVEMARLNLSYTVVRAPYNGTTGRRNIQEGQLLQTGQNLLMFVRNDHKWIVANYRETQIAKLHIGQKVRLSIDGIDNKELTGVVSAISQATGSRYSAIPVDNSTGNFVKVQQRIPVKIDLLPGHGRKGDINKLIAGMNVEVRTIQN